MGEQVVGAHQEPGRAEAALEGVVLAERLLQGVQLVLAAEAFDGGDLRTVELDREEQAGAGGLAVDEDGAHPADAVLAPDVGAGQAEVVAERVGQGGPGWKRQGDLAAVDGDGDVDGLVGLGAGVGVRETHQDSPSRVGRTDFR
jgi:hypothetical protein